MDKKTPFNITAEKIGKKIEPFQLKAELVLVFIFLVGLILKSLETGMGSIIILVSLSVLVYLYFFIGFLKVKETKSIMELFINKLIYWSFSVTIFGILFILNKYPGALIMLQIGLSTIVVGLLSFYIFRTKYNIDSKLFKSIAIRGLVLLGFVVVLYLNGNISEYRAIENQNVNKELLIDE